MFILLAIIAVAAFLLLLCFFALAEIASNSRRIREDVNDIKRLLIESGETLSPESGEPLTRYDFHVVK